MVSNLMQNGQIACRLLPHLRSVKQQGQQDPVIFSLYLPLPGSQISGGWADFTDTYRQCIVFPAGD